MVRILRGFRDTIRDTIATPSRHYCEKRLKTVTKRVLNRIIAALFSAALFGCTAHSPSGATSAWSKGAMASVANPYATDAAQTMLKQGGHAVDAAIAAHLVLGLVEPQSSGLGGGGFLLVYDSSGRALSFYDGREAAPAGASVDMFMQDGEPIGYLDAWQSGLAIGVPGAVAMYKLAHDAHGRLPWSTLFEPAIQLAEDGFVVSPRLAGYLPVMAQRGRLDEDEGAAAYFYPGGTPLQAGDVRDNKPYARTLKRIAAEGPDAFYQGEIAASIAAAAQSAPFPGTLTADDIGSYQAVVRPVICGAFREDRICTTSPPSSGGAQIMIASLYDHLVADSTATDDRIAAFVDAQRLAYADRDRYFGDPDEVDIPLDDLLNPLYLKERAKQRFAPDEKPTPGNPAVVLGKLASAYPGPDTTEESPGTTHLSIVDLDGNAVALTATVEAPFGTSRFVHGFLLNNELTDFARTVPKTGELPANAVGPGKRPRSSMSPTMVLDKDNQLLMVTGSPGGNSIPAYVAKTIIGVVGWGLSAQEAADHPNIIARGEQVRVEVGVGDGQAIADMLNARGYSVREREGENSGIHLIIVRPDGLEGAADKRREGTVVSVQRE